MRDHVTPILEQSFPCNADPERRSLGALPVLHWFEHARGFAGKRELLTDESVESAKAPLYEQIGRLQVEVGFLRKKLGPLL